MSISFLLIKIRALFTKISSFIDGRVEQFGAQYVAFGILGVVNYPLSYFMWHDIKHQAYESLGLRLVASLLCLPLALKNFWPKRLLSLLPMYWYLTILYCLPFFASFMLLKNHLSSDWLMNTVLGLLLLVLVVDWLSFTLLLSLGAGLALLAYSLIGEHISLNRANDNISLAIYMYFFVVAIVAFFSHRKEKLQREKLKGMMSVGTSIAHELRTPLASIDGGIAGAKKYLPKLIDTYEIAKKANLPVPAIRPVHYEKLLTLLEEISAETHYANTIIDMLLVKIQQSDIGATDGEEHSIVDCIDEALRRYPFEDSEKIKKIHCDMNTDFFFKGKKLLIIHVLFNLLKNASYFINEAQKGEIFIWATTLSDNYNSLHFKDTAKGISPQAKLKLFERFYSNTRNGTGLGLAFCRMVMVGIGGNISCKSEEGEYTEFIMTFPKIRQGD